MDLEQGNKNFRWTIWIEWSIYLYNDFNNIVIQKFDAY